MLRNSSTRTTGVPSSSRRGAQLLEFCFVLPIFLFLILFSLDMGRMVFYSGIVHDATYTAARAGAQVGGAGTDERGASREAYFDALAQIPGSDVDKAAAKGTFEVESGEVCRKLAGDRHRYVRVKGTFSVDFITPGMRTLLSLAGNGDRLDNEGSWKLPAVGVARCEVVRS